MPTATIKTRSIQAESLSAATDRLANTVSMREGVVDNAGGSYQVLQDTGTNMQVKVGSGTAFDRAIVEGDFAGQGTFILEHQDATVTLAVAASDPTNDRIDIVVARTKDDTFDSSGLNESDVEIITGTPAATPAAPAVPNTAFKLAEVLVGAGVTAITDANITDFRYEAPARGQLVETQYFTVNGTFDKADFPWLDHVIVKAQAAGGAGGGAPVTAAGETSTGGGGGGGAYAEDLIAVGDLAASETVTVGQGGAGSAGAGGAAGGSSSFGAHAVAGGGSGGANSSAQSPGVTVGRAGQGGSATAGDVQTKGGGGSPGVTATFSSGGSGGDSVLGGGAANTSSNATGQDGGLYGGGGSGASNHASQGSARAGGDGADGIVVVELYA